jgi:hypothetical protein
MQSIIAGRLAEHYSLAPRLISEGVVPRRATVSDQRQERMSLFNGIAQVPGLRGGVGETRGVCAIEDDLASSDLIDPRALENPAVLERVREARQDATSTTRQERRRVSVPD